MQQIHVPYGKTGMTVDIADENLLGVYETTTPQPAADQAAEVENALDNPIASPSLEELARDKKNAVIIASDHTRPVPSKYIIPAMLKRLRKFNPQIDISILIATGCHRETTREELEAKFGKDIVDNEKIVIHDCTDSSMYCNLGTLPSGGKLIVNRLAAEADLLVSEGFIEPHFFAGYSGGRKSVLPGIAARETVLANHCAEFISSPFARTGILNNNPIHEDMLFAAKAAKLAFIVNVVIDHDKKIVRAFAGNSVEAHKTGCDYLDKFCKVTVPEADIVITSNGGYPLDQNIYQSVKGMTAGEAVCRPGGVIILSASCCDGHGGKDFCQALTAASSVPQFLREIERIPRNKTEQDQWQYQILLRILEKFKVIMVTRDCDHEMIKAMKLDVASSIDEALSMAYQIVGNSAKVAVIPDGVSVVAAKL
ncbi:MAG: nickel-dependent lactate racemase [Lentisphaeria bacterium]|nr:nickel-dependent lactate racemase [Lentisphaeria bacterium]MBO5990620.1 nickel-dependent lactate racemase [Lentisphaeria bacterium]